jgi:Domain of unknown function (DUF6362)
VTGRRTSPEIEALVALLEEAGATLLSLPPSGYSTALRSGALPFVREAGDAYGWDNGPLRPPVPSAARISRMDATFAKILLIPEDRLLLRRVVGCRALVHPLTGRHLYAWRRLAEMLGSDHKAVQRWHMAGIDLILLALRARAVTLSATNQQGKLYSLTAAGSPP